MIIVSMTFYLVVECVFVIMFCKIFGIIYKSIGIDRRFFIRYFFLVVGWRWSNLKLGGYKV